MPVPLIVNKNELLISVGDVSVQFGVAAGNVIESDGEVDDTVRGVMVKVQEQLSSDIHRAINSGDFNEFREKYTPMAMSPFGLVEKCLINDFLISQAIEFYGVEVFDKVNVDDLIDPAFEGVGDLAELDHGKTKDLILKIYSESEADALLSSFVVKNNQELRPRRSNRF